MTEDKEIGCGVSRIYMTSKDDPFYMSCEIHDAMYSKGSSVQKNLTRKEADSLFLEHMLLKAGNSWKLRVRAYLYYYIVRIFAGHYWEGNQ